MNTAYNFQTSPVTCSCSSELDLSNTNHSAPLCALRCHGGRYAGASHRFMPRPPPTREGGFGQSSFGALTTSLFRASDAGALPPRIIIIPRLGLLARPPLPPAAPFSRSPPPTPAPNLRRSSRSSLRQRGSHRSNRANDEVTPPSSRADPPPPAAAAAAAADANSEMTLSRYWSSFSRTAVRPLEEVTVGLAAVGLASTGSALFWGFERVADEGGGVVSRAASFREMTGEVVVRATWLALLLLLLLLALLLLAVAVATAFAAENSSLLLPVLSLLPSLSLLLSCSSSEELLDSSESSPKACRAGHEEQF